MKRTLKIVILAVLAISCFLCAVGCGSVQIPEKQNKYSFVTPDCFVNLYEEYQVKITPTDYEQVKWTSGDTNVATVDQNGKISAKSIGKTKIIAEVGGEVISANLNVVYGGNSPSVYLSDDVYSVALNGKLKISPKILYKGVLYEDGEFSMEVLDNDICTIENGEIKGVSYGKTQLFVYGKWRGASKLELIKVVDVLVQKDSNLVLDKTQTTIYTEQISYKEQSFTNQGQFGANLFVEGQKVTDKTIEWKVSDQSLISIDQDGKITANTDGKEGTAYVWAEVKTDDVFVESDRAEVNVIYPVIDKTLDVELLFDLSVGTGSVDCNDVFGSDVNIDKVIDVKFAKNNMYNGGVVNLTAKTEGERQWIIGSKTYGVKVSAICATKIIRTADDLHVFDEKAQSQVYGYYILDGNVDATDFKPTAHTWSTYADVGFAGTLNGRNYTIDNLNCGTNGLFGALSESSTVKDIAFTNVNLNEKIAFAGTSYGKIENVFIHVKSSGIKTEYDQDDNPIVKKFATVITHVRGGTISNLMVVVDEKASDVHESGIFSATVGGSFKNIYGICNYSRISGDALNNVTVYEKHLNTNNYGETFPVEWTTIDGLPCPQSAKSIIENSLNK